MNRISAGIALATCQYGFSKLIFNITRFRALLSVLFKGGCPKLSVYALKIKEQIEAALA